MLTFLAIWFGAIALLLVWTSCLMKDLQNVSYSPRARRRKRR